MDNRHSSKYDGFTVSFDDEDDNRPTSANPFTTAEGWSTAKRSVAWSNPSPTPALGKSDEQGYQLSYNNDAASNSHKSLDADKIDDAEQIIHFRKNGEAEAARRPITAHWDEIDQTIVNLKEKNWRNADIVAHMKKITKGAVNYDAKTIGTRYTRLKQAQTDEADRLLDDELTDWHEGEDESLLEADALGQAEMYAEFERQKQKRWETTAKLLQKKLKKNVAYSAKSCQKRFEALENDTARIPPELDDNPEKRKAEKAEKKLARLKREQKREAEKLLAKDMKRLTADHKRIKQIEEQKERLAMRSKAIEKKEQEALAKVYMSGAAVKADLRRGDENKGMPAALQQGANAGNTSIDTLKVSAGTAPDISAHEKTFKGTGKASGDRIPLGFDDSRKKMTVEELHDLCRARGLSKGGKKAVLLNRLAQNDANLTEAALNMALMERGCQSEGTREERLACLAMADASESNWGRKMRGEIIRKGKGFASAVYSHERACPDATDDGEPTPKRARTRPPSSTGESEIAEYDDAAYTDAMSGDVKMSTARIEIVKMEDGKKDVAEMRNEKMENAKAKLVKMEDDEMIETKTTFGKSKITEWEDPDDADDEKPRVTKAVRRTFVKSAGKNDDE